MKKTYTTRPDDEIEFSVQTENEHNFIIEITDYEPGQTETLWDPPLSEDWDYNLYLVKNNRKKLLKNISGTWMEDEVNDQVEKNKEKNAEAAFDF